MLQPTDFKEKQILFIDTRAEEGKSAIRFQNDHIVYTKDEKVVNRASCHKALVVFIVGEISITSSLLRKGAELGVTFVLMNSNYKHYASVGMYAEGNYLLRSRQYTLSDKENLHIAKHLIANKILNQARLLGKKSSDDDVRKVLQKVHKSKDRETLLGTEGNYAHIFFKTYFSDIGWRKRAPRAKEDIPNLLLDIGYTVLFNICEAILRAYGFDLYKGVYHQLFFARKSLVTDIEEPFRCIVDHALKKAYALDRVKEEDFVVKKNGEYMLPWKHSAKYYRIFSEAILDRKMEIYDYIYNFYIHIILPNENKLKNFNINKNYKK
jgi:CRISPR-associated protein Cas1